jgi:hypothetical protein
MAEQEAGGPEGRVVRVPESFFRELYNLEEGIARAFLVLCWQEDLAPVDREPLTTKQVATMAGISGPRARVALVELAETGWALRLRGGRWILRENLPDAPPEWGRRGGEVRCGPEQEGALERGSPPKGEPEGERTGSNDADFGVGARASGGGVRGSARRPGDRPGGPERE